MPVSVIVTTASLPERSMVTQSWPLDAMYLQALFTRFPNTWPSRAGSASTMIDGCGAMMLTS